MSALLHGMGQLLAYFYSLIPNYGVAIIMLTVLVRTAMIPLAIKQAHSMQANRGNAEKIRKLQPEVKKLKEKYKDDRQRQYEEQKRLYEENGVNMLGQLGGCLPVLLQMPIFLAMYAVLQGCSAIFAGRNCEPGYHIPKESPLYSAIVDRTARFLGANLERSPADVFGQAGVAQALPYLLLIGVMGLTMWYQTQMMMKMQPALDPQMAATQKVMKFMPLMIVVFSWNFPAGLIVYWSASNAWTIGQQFVLMKKYGGPLPETDGHPKSKAGTATREPAGHRKAEPKKPAGASGAKGASSASSTKGRAAGNTKAAQPRPGGGTRNPAAKQARTSATKGSTEGSGKASGNGKSSSGQPKSGNGAASGTAGRPKGSGARKGNKGGRR
ncbi:MAG TPA: membrane protein insertase YidC [Actinomycetota bacterium]|nr:membrane protein insertase YidC [Actinomycetota bacterium]